MNSKTLVIAGMHRSGTSLVAHYLNECGFYIGDDLLNIDLAPSQASQGHHEDKAFLKFHTDVLKAQRVEVFVSRESKLPIKVSPEMRARASQLVASRENFSQWAWKDPRTTLFLDFWNEMLDQPKYLFLFRHPLTVVDSILRRGTDRHITKKPIIGLRAWNVYNYQILKFFKAHSSESFLCEIDTLITQPQQLRNKLEKDWDFELKSVSFEEVFTKKAFNADDSISQPLGRWFSRDIAKAESLYAQLVEMASNQ